MSEQEGQDQILAEQQEARQMGHIFAEACANGEVDRMHLCADFLTECIGGWYHAMRRIAKLATVSPEVQTAFEDIWVEKKGLSRPVGDRRILVNALRVLFPGGSLPDRTVIYRGTSFSERKKRRYFFSWTTDIAVAKNFACSRSHHRGGGVVLSTCPPAAAILRVRPRTTHFDEGEIVVDPFALREVAVVERVQTPLARP